MGSFSWNDGKTPTDAQQDSWDREPGEFFEWPATPRGNGDDLPPQQYGDGYA